MLAGPCIRLCLGFQLVAIAGGLEAGAPSGPPPSFCCAVTHTRRLTEPTPWHAGRVPPPTVAESTSKDARRGEVSPRVYAVVVGLSYLAITLCGMLGVGVLDARLHVQGDPTATAANILAHGLSFRLGIVSVVVIYASVLVASWALYLILERVDRGLSLLALLFRLAEGIVGFATTLTSLTIVRLLRPGGTASALDEGRIAVWVGLMLELRTAALDIVLCLIGVGGTIFLVLFWRSRLIPRWLALWGAATYASMLCLALVSILSPDHPRSIEAVLYGLGGAFEGVFGLWMLVRGIDVERWGPYGGAPLGHEVPGHASP